MLSSEGLSSRKHEECKKYSVGPIGKGAAPFRAFTRTNVKLDTMECLS